MMKAKSHDLLDEEDLRSTRTISKLLGCLAGSNISTMHRDMFELGGTEEEEGEGEGEDRVGALEVGVLAFGCDCF